MMNKTKVVEIFGIPKSGKTTTVAALAKYMHSLDIKTRVVKERASVSPIKNKLHPLFNYWTAISFMKELVEAINDNIQLLITDRGIIDALMWILYFNRNHEFDYEYNSYLKIINNDFLLDRLLCGYYFKTDLDRVISRVNKRSVGKYQGRVMNKEVISGYSSMFTKIKESMPAFPDIIEVDTTDMDIQTMIKAIADDLSSRLHL